MPNPNDINDVARRAEETARPEDLAATERWREEHRNKVAQMTESADKPKAPMITINGEFRKCICSVSTEAHFHMDENTIITWDEFERSMLAYAKQNSPAVVSLNVQYDRIDIFGTTPRDIWPEPQQCSIEAKVTLEPPINYVPITLHLANAVEPNVTVVWSDLWCKECRLRFGDGHTTWCESGTQGTALYTNNPPTIGKDNK